MKLKDLKIGTQLRIALGVIYLFVALLGTIAWFEAEGLWQNTEGLYNHPLKVRRAVGDLTADIIAMHSGMKDLFLTEDKHERPAIIQGIDTYQADAYRQFEILYKQYLGPRNDIDQAYNSFVQWKPIRDDTIRLLKEGNIAEALDRTKFSGVGGSHAEKIIDLIKNVSNFAKNREDQFYQDAQNNRNNLILRLKVVLAAILLLSICVGYVLFKGVRDPLNELTSVTEQYRQGKLDARSRYVSGNEFGLLGASFNALADTIQAEMQSRENAGRIAEVMLREEELHAFCRELLTALLRYTDSQIGAVYLLNKEMTHFEHFESIGMSVRKRASFSVEGSEGEFGAALATRQIQRITNIPEDTRFSFLTVSGDFKPREIITIPILSGQNVGAMISLASLRNYDEKAVRLLNDVVSTMTARLNGVLASQQIREFSQKLASQNRELAAQKDELVAQKNELNEQNVELEVQKNQLDQANRLKSTFLSNMSHELRTPLNSVIALSGVLNRRLRGAIPEEEYGYLEVIERNGKNLLALINDILDLSRIEAGREDISLSSFSVRALVGEIVEMIGPQAEEKSIALVSLVDENLPTVTSDVSKCRHILQNLVGNAVKFTEEGEVKISAGVLRDEIYIAVTDTGIGVPAAHLSHIFDEFRQAEESSSRKYGGSGLGLAIAKKYATLVQGRISVESIHGKGSTFTLLLPLKMSLPSDDNQWIAPGTYSLFTEPAEHVSSIEHGNKSILLVEDSEPAIIQITDILEEKGFEVQVARNGREALEQIEKEVPDAMILDLMMPEVDGFEVLQTIRDEEKTAHIPVLILSAKHITKDELDFIRGNNVYQLIQKGHVNKKELLTAVTNMVSRKSIQEMLGGKS